MKHFPKLLLYYLLLCPLLLLIVTSCSPSAAVGGGGASAGSVYFWRTTFSLKDAEREFLDKHGICKMYIRFFDADYDYNEKDVVPVATIQFFDSIPGGIEIVPTIYITDHAMEEMQLREEEFADKFLRRVNAICKRYHISYDEIQLDCDWTKGTREHFYRLCEAVKARLDPPRRLSSTIRLHQLTQSPPPVDKGVLMVYNTGNFKDEATRNSIFSYDDIEPYLRDDRLTKFGLPLDIAYPAYGWSLVFYPRKEEYLFARITRHTDFSDCPGLKKIGSNMYEATATVELPPDENSKYIYHVYEGYRIRVERPSAGEILKVKALIERRLAGKPHGNIIYHLDEEQLSHYSDNEISEILARN